MNFFFFVARHHVTLIDNAQKAVLIKRIQLSFSNQAQSDSIVEAAFAGTLRMQ